MKSVLELLGMIIDLEYSEMFIHAEDGKTIIELQDYTIITELILPLCDSACADFISASKWFFAKLVFVNDPARLSEIVIENDKGECIVNDVGCAILQDYERRKLGKIYVAFCQHLIDDVDLALSLM